MCGMRARAWRSLRPAERRAASPPPLHSTPFHTLPYPSTPALAHPCLPRTRSSASLGSSAEAARCANTPQLAASRRLHAGWRRRGSSSRPRGCAKAPA
eukprot:202896-Chlamydomonas_euryale.AAC.1